MRLKLLLLIAAVTLIGATGAHAQSVTIGVDGTNTTTMGLNAWPANDGAVPTPVATKLLVTASGFASHDGNMITDYEIVFFGPDNTNLPADGDSDPDEIGSFNGTGAPMVYNNATGATFTYSLSTIGDANILYAAGRFQFFDGATTTIYTGVVTGAAAVGMAQGDFINIDLVPVNASITAPASSGYLGAMATVGVTSVSNSDSDVNVALAGATQGVKFQVRRTGDAVWYDVPSANVALAGGWMANALNNFVIDFDAIDVDNDSDIEELIVTGTNGATVELRGTVTDDGGNITQLGTRTLLTVDTVAPSVMATATTTTTTITVQFSETLNFTTATAGRFTVNNTPNGASNLGLTNGAPIAVMSVANNGSDTVTLTLASPINGGDRPTVTVSNLVTDLAGNGVQAGGNNGAHATDGIPATLLEANLNSPGNKLLLVFNEPMSLNGGAAYGVSSLRFGDGSSNPINTVNATNAVAGNYTLGMKTFAEDTIIVDVSGWMDRPEGGNLVIPNTLVGDAAQHLKDKNLVTPNGRTTDPLNGSEGVAIIVIPTLDDIVYNAETHTMTLLFSKNIQRASLLANIGNFQFVNASNGVAINMFVPITGASVPAKPIHTTTDNDDQNFSSYVDGMMATVYPSTTNLLPLTASSNSFSFRVSNWLDEAFYSTGALNNVGIKLVGSSILDTNGVALLDTDQYDLMGVDLSYAGAGDLGAHTDDATPMAYVSATQKKALAMDSPGISAGAAGVEESFAGRVIDVVYDDYIHRLDVANLANWLVNGATQPTSATLLTDGKTVRLVFAAAVDLDVNDGTATPSDLDVLAMDESNAIAPNEAPAVMNQVIATTGINATSTVTTGTQPMAATINAVTGATTAQSVFTFVVTDLGGGDTLATRFTSVILDVVQTGGVAFDPSEHTWTLTGGTIPMAGVNAVVNDNGTAGVYTDDWMTFDLSAMANIQSIADGMNATYTVSVKFAASPMNTVDGSMFTVSRAMDDADIVSNGGSTFAAAATFSGNTFTYDIQATHLRFVTINGAPAPTAHVPPMGGFTIGSALDEGAFDFANTQLGATFPDTGSITVEYIDQLGRRDLDANGATENLRIRFSTNQVIKPQVNLSVDDFFDVTPVMGLATFNQFVGANAFQNNIVKEVTVRVQRATGVTYNPTGNVATAGSMVVTNTQTFDILPDTNSTIAEESSPTTLDFSGDPTAYRELWDLTITDAVGGNDGLPTKVSSMSFDVALGGAHAANFALSDFEFQLDWDNDAAAFTASDGMVTGVSGAATITFNTIGVNVLDDAAGSVRLSVRMKAASVAAATVAQKQTLDALSFALNLDTTGTLDLNQVGGDVTQDSDNTTGAPVAINTSIIAAAALVNANDARWDITASTITIEVMKDVGMTMALDTVNGQPAVRTGTAFFVRGTYVDANGFYDRTSHANDAMTVDSTNAVINTNGMGVGGDTTGTPVAGVTPVFSVTFTAATDVVGAAGAPTHALTMVDSSVAGTVGAAGDLTGVTVNSSTFNVRATNDANSSVAFNATGNDTLTKDYVNLWQVVVTDAGTSDFLGTTLNAMTLTTTAAAFDGTNDLTELEFYASDNATSGMGTMVTASSVTASTIVWDMTSLAGIGAIAAADASSNKTIYVHGRLKNSVNGIPGNALVIDGDNFQIQIFNAAGITLAPAGTTINIATAPGDGNPVVHAVAKTIDVRATTLAFTGQPGFNGAVDGLELGVDAATFTAAANDAWGNRDTGAMALTAIAAFADDAYMTPVAGLTVQRPTPVTLAPVAGVYTFTTGGATTALRLSGVVHDDARLRFSAADSAGGAFTAHFLIDTLPSNEVVLSAHTGAELTMITSITSVATTVFDFKLGDLGNDGLDGVVKTIRVNADAMGTPNSANFGDFNWTLEGGTVANQLPMAITGTVNDNGTVGVYTDDWVTFDLETAENADDGSGDAFTQAKRSVANGTDAFYTVKVSVKQQRLYTPDNAKLILVMNKDQVTMDLTLGSGMLPNVTVVGNSANATTTGGTTGVTLTVGATDLRVYTQLADATSTAVIANELLMTPTYAHVASTVVGDMTQVSAGGLNANFPVGRNGGFDFIDGAPYAQLVFARVDVNGNLDDAAGGAALDVLYAASNDPLNYTINEVGNTELDGNSINNSVGGTYQFDQLDINNLNGISTMATPRNLVFTDSVLTGAKSITITHVDVYTADAANVEINNAADVLAVPFELSDATNSPVAVATVELRDLGGPELNDAVLSSLRVTLSDDDANSDSTNYLWTLGSSVMGATAHTGTNTMAGQIDFTGLNASHFFVDTNAAPSTAGTTRMGGTVGTTLVTTLTLYVQRKAVLDFNAAALNTVDGTAFTAINFNTPVVGVGTTLSGQVAAGAAGFDVNVTADRLALEMQEIVASETLVAGYGDSQDFTLEATDAFGLRDEGRNDAVVVTRSDSGVLDLLANLGATVSTTGAPFRSINVSIAGTSLAAGVATFTDITFAQPVNAMGITVNFAADVTAVTAGAEMVSSNAFNLSGDTELDLDMVTDTGNDMASTATAQFSVLTFRLIDADGNDSKTDSDMLPSIIDTVVLTNTAATKAALADATWVLDAGGGVTAVGVIATDTLTFSFASDVVIPDDGSRVFTLLATPKAQSIKGQGLGALASVDGSAWTFNFGLAATSLASAPVADGAGNQTIGANEYSSIDAAPTAPASSTTTVNVTADRLRFDYTGSLPNLTVTQAVSGANLFWNAFTVQATDIHGNVDTGAAGTVTATWSGAPGTGTMLNNAIALASGAAAFPALGVDLAADRGLMGGNLSFTTGPLTLDIPTTGTNTAMVVAAPATNYVALANLTVDVRGFNDADSTMVNGTNNGALDVTSISAPVAVWQLSLSDLGTSDDKPTVINSIVVRNVLANNGSGASFNNVDSFIWSANGIAGTTAIVNDTTGDVTFTFGTPLSLADMATDSTRTGPTGGLVSQTTGAAVANPSANFITITMGVKQDGTVTNKAALDNMTITPSVMTVNSTPAGQFGGALPTRGAPITVRVAATKLLQLAATQIANLTADTYIPAVSVEFTDANGNRDLDADTDVVTVSRIDNGMFTNASGMMAAPATAMATDGVATFTNSIALGYPAFDNGYLTFTDDAIGNVVSATVVNSNSFDLNGAAEVQVQNDGAGNTTNLQSTQSTLVEIWSWTVSDAGGDAMRGDISTIRVNLTSTGTFDASDFQWTLDGTTINAVNAVVSGAAPNFVLTFDMSNANTAPAGAVQVAEAGLIVIELFVLNKRIATPLTTTGITNTIDQATFSVSLDHATDIDFLAADDWATNGQVAGQTDSATVKTGSTAVASNAQASAVVTYQVAGSKLNMVMQPTDDRAENDFVRAGKVMQVSVSDTYGNVDINFGTSLVVSDIENAMSTPIGTALLNAPTDSNLTGTHLGNGVHEWTNLQIKTAATYSLIVSPSSGMGATPVETAQFVIDHAVAPSYFAITSTGQPGATHVAGTTGIGATVQIYDLYNNLYGLLLPDGVTTDVTAVAVMMSATLNQGMHNAMPTTGTLLTGTGSFTMANNGTITLSGLSVDKVGTGYTLSLAATNGVVVAPMVPPLTPAATASATTNAFAITHSVHTKTVITNQPMSTDVFTAGTSLINITVEVRDTYDNILTTGAQPMVSITSDNPAARPFSPLVPVTPTMNGSVTFMGLRVDKAGSITPQVVAGSIVANPLANTFTIKHAAADHIGLVASSETGAGTFLAGSASISASFQLFDQFGNPANEIMASGFNITASLRAPLPHVDSAIVTGTATVATNAVGVAAISGLGINKVGMYHVDYTAAGLPGLGGATQYMGTQQYTITGGHATDFAITSDFTGMTFVAGDAANMPVAPIMVSIQLKDAYDNDATLGQGGSPLILSPGAVSIDTVASPMNDAALQPLSSAGLVTGGVFTFNGQAIQRAGSGYVLRVTIPAGGGLGGMAVSKVTAPFDVKHAAATQMTVTSSPTAVPYVAGAANIGASFTLRDTFNNVVDSMGDQVSVTVDTAPTAGRIVNAMTNATVNSMAGVATFSGLDIQLIDLAYTLTATAGAIVSPATATFEVRPAAINNIQFAMDPSTQTVVAGQPLSSGDGIGAPMIRFRDIYTNVINGTYLGAPISISAVSNNPGSIVAGTTAATDATTGIANFGGIVINAAGTYSITFTVPSMMGIAGITATGINVIPGAADHVTVLPGFTGGNKTAGLSIGTLTAQVEDVFGNNVPMATNVTVTIDGLGGDGSVPVFTNGPAGNTYPTSTVNTTSSAMGLVSLTNLALNRVGTNYAIRIVVPGNAMDMGSTSNTFNINHAPASQMIPVPAAQPAATIVAGQPFSTQLTLLDPFDNIATSATNNVSVTLSQNSFFGIPTVNVSNGLATISNIQVRTASAVPYTLNYGAMPAAGTASSTPFTVVPAAVNSLTVATPSNVVSTQPFSVNVTMFDLYTNVVNNSPGTNLTIGIQTNGGEDRNGMPSAGTLTGAVATADGNADGMVQFNGLSINRKGTNYTLQVQVQGSSPVIAIATNGFPVAIGAPASFTVTTQPGPVIVKTGQAITGSSFAAEIFDAGSNLVIPTSVPVTLSLVPDVTVPSATLNIANATQNTTTGSASFSGYTITANPMELGQTGKTFQLRMTTGGVTVDSTLGINVIGGPILQRVWHDDRDNNTTVDASDILVFVFDEKVQLNASGNLDTDFGAQAGASFGTGAGAWGAGATAFPAIFMDDIETKILGDASLTGVGGALAGADMANLSQYVLAVRLGTGETVSATTTFNPGNAVTDLMLNPDITAAPQNIVAGSDTFRPYYTNVTASGDLLLSEGEIFTITMAQSDLFAVAPTVSIAIDSGAPVMHAMVQDAVNPRMWSYTFTAATGADGAYALTINNASMDAAGNLFDANGFMATGAWTVDTTAPIYSAAVDLASAETLSIFNNGDTFQVRAIMTEGGLSLTGMLPANAGLDVVGAITFDAGSDNGDGTFTYLSQALMVTAAATVFDGTIMVEATDAALNSTSNMVGYSFDTVVPTGSLSANVPFTHISVGGSVMFTAIFSEALAGVPTITINHNGGTDVVDGAAMTGSGQQFTFTWAVDALVMDTDMLTISVNNAADAAGNAVAPALSMIMGSAIAGPAPVVADAGADMMLAVPALITLGGANTTAAGVTYAWSLESDPTGTGTFTADTATTEFTAFTRPGSYIFRLTVTDGTLTASDTVQVTVANIPPTATVATGTRVMNGIANSSLPATLSGTAFDANGMEDVANTEWRNGKRASNGTVTANSGNLVTDAAGNLTCADANIVGGQYWFHFVVTDFSGAMGYANRLVSVVGPANADGSGNIVLPPSAHAGIPQSVLVNDTVTVSANESKITGAIDTGIFAWTVTDPNGATTSLTNTKIATFNANMAGIWTATVTVTDPVTTMSAEASVEITAIASGQGVRLNISSANASANDIRNSHFSFKKGTLAVGDISVSATGEEFPDVTWAQIDGPQTVNFSNDASSGTGNGLYRHSTFLTLPVDNMVSGTYRFRVTGVSPGKVVIPARATVTIVDAGSTNLSVSLSLATEDQVGNRPNKSSFFGGGVNGDVNNPSIQIGAVVTGGFSDFTYIWEQVSGPIAIVSGENTDTLSIVPEANGDVLTRVYEFAFTVEDRGPDASEFYRTETIAIAVGSYNPATGTGQAVPDVDVVNANGAVVTDVNSVVNTPVSLFAQGIDLDGNTNLTYVWVQISGPPVVLTNANTANPTFEPTEVGTYIFNVFVDDGGDIGLPAEVKVNVGTPKKRDDSSCSLSVTGGSNNLYGLAALMMLFGLAMVVRRRREEA